MSQTLFNIQSRYILKSIFSILNYDHILKILKYNKKLQKTLGINNINYKERSSFQIKERKTIVEKKYYRYYHGRAHGLETCFNYFTPGSLPGMLFIYVLIFSSILACKRCF